jgi:hypothetical protein
VKHNIYKFILIVLFLTGVCLIYKIDILNSFNFYQNKFLHSVKQETQIKNLKSDSSALILQKYLLSSEKPSKVEIIGLSNKFQNSINEIKKIKITQDKQSKIYYSIQLFSNESDPESTLIAQIKTIENSTGNTLKEESLDLK